MLKQLRSVLIRWLWRKNVEKPQAYQNYSEPYATITCPEQALTLSPVYAALDLYKRTLSTLPLVTYKRSDKGRERARELAAFKVLHDRMNPGMSPITFLEMLVSDYFLHGEFFALVQRAGNGDLLSLFPIPHDAVLKVTRNADWSTTYTIKTDEGTREVPDTDVIAILKDSPDGLRGTSLIDFAATNLSLHSQVQASATNFYKNATKPSVYVKGEWGKAEARQQQEKEFNERYSGVVNSGKAPFISGNADIVKFPNTTAEESRAIEMLSISVQDASRWFSVSPLLLSDLTRGTYSNLAADNLAFYQKSLRPLLVKIEAEVNYKIFGIDSVNYAEFLTQSVLRGSPEQEQQIINGYVTAGIMTVAEARELLNLPFINGTDTLTRPVNQAVVTGDENAQPLDQPQDVKPQEQEEQPQ